MPPIKALHEEKLYLVSEFQVCPKRGMIYRAELCEKIGSAKYLTEDEFSRLKTKYVGKIPFSCLYVGMKIKYAESIGTITKLESYGYFHVEWEPGNGGLSTRVLHSVSGSVLV